MLRSSAKRLVLIGGLVSATALGAAGVAMRARSVHRPAPASCCPEPPPRFPSAAAARNAPAKEAAPPTPADQPPAGMVWIPGGRFRMGTEDRDAWPAETPPHSVRVSGFWIDRTDVTNGEFRRFVEATGYVSTAERKPDWEELKKQLPPGTPPPPAEKLVAGSLVFTAPAAQVPLGDVSRWWSWTPGANWRHPEGPGSTLEGRDDHPVVQVSWDDAAAYCKWAGKRLPSEAEWEFAARGGLPGERYSWGQADISDEHPQCNVWQGRFPDRNTAADGFARTSPVGKFKANGYGLYDMAGNVWQWCSDWYRADEYSRDAERGTVSDPRGPEESLDPDEPYTPKRVTRGGSFLCNASYCSSYRVSARRGTSPDSSMSHLGFRCVRDGP